MTTNAKKTTQYTKEVTPHFKQFQNVGDEVHGVLLEKRTQLFGDREIGRYTIEQEGERVTFLGSEQIDQLISHQEIGYDFMLQYTGDVTARSGNKVKQFKLFETS